MNDKVEEKQIQKIERDVYVSLREHFEAILHEQNRAIDAATIEREKAASILREGLLRQITSGDQALDRHIREQIEQVKNLIEAQKTLINQAAASSSLAISKAEEATEKRLALLNEFRAQSVDAEKRYASRELVDDRLGKVENQISRMYGGILVVGIIGIANLVKLWFAH